MLSIHVHGDSTRTVKSLQVTLGSRGTTEVVQLAQNLEHSRQRNGAHLYSQALVRTKAKVGVQAHITIKTDLVRVREGDRITACDNL